MDDQYFLLTNLLGNTINRVSRDGDNEAVLEGLSSPMGLVHNGRTVYVANYGSTRRSIGEWYALDDVLGGTADPADANHVLVSGLQNTTGLQLGAAMASCTSRTRSAIAGWSGVSTREFASTTAAAPTIRSRLSCTAT
ncbi:MAG: hypothetical protein U0703_02975 [Anaerolineae bacterium]